MNRRDSKKKWEMSVLEVECEVSSQVEYSLQAIWGVSIRELHLALWKPWSTLRDASLNGTLLQGYAQHLTPPQTYPSRLRFCDRFFLTPSAKRTFQSADPLPLRRRSLSDDACRKDSSLMFTRTTAAASGRLNLPSVIFPMPDHLSLTRGE